MAVEQQGTGVQDTAASLRRAAALLLLYAAFRFGIGVLRLPDNTPGLLLLIANALVALGACGFVVFSGLVGQGDPTRVAAQVVSGIGFLAPASSCAMG